MGYYRFKHFEVSEYTNPYNNTLTIWKVCRIDNKEIVYSGGETDCLVWLIRKLEARII